MEKSKNSTWLTHKLEIFLRNVVLVLNASLWLFVLYFSIHDDEIAAFLSYVSVTLTILTVKYYLWEVISNNTSVAYFMDCSSKTLILAGISLVILPEFWNTAFYSICLGIIMQTAKRELQVRGRNEILYLLMQVPDEDAKTETNDGMNLLGTLLNAAHMMEIRKMKDLNREECYKSTSLNENDLQLENGTENQTIEMKQCEESIQKGIQSFHEKLNKCHPDVSETLSDHEKIVVSCRKENNPGDPEESDKNENSLHDYNSQRKTASMERIESTLRRMECFTQSNVVSSYGDTEEIHNTEKLCTKQIQLLNLMESLDYSKIDPHFERVLKRNDEASVDISVKHVALNNENREDFLKGIAKQLDTTDNSIETMTEPGNTRKNEFHPEQVNACSDVNSTDSENFNKNDSISSCGGKNSFQTNQSESKCEIDGEPVHVRLFIKDSENLLSFNSDSTVLDTALQHKENTCKVNSQKVDTDSKLENSSENNGNSHSEPKYESLNCTSIKTINIQPEKEMKAYQMKCIPENFNYDSTNLNDCLQNKERLGEALSIDFETNGEKNLNGTKLQENSFESNKNLNSEVECSNMNCASLKTSDIQSEKDISQTKLISQQVNDGNLEAVLGKVLLESEYPSKSKCLRNFKIFKENSTKLNESADVEEIDFTNESAKKTSVDEGTTHFSNVSKVDDVVNRIDLSFIYALGFNVPCTEHKF